MAHSKLKYSDFHLKMTTLGGGALEQTEIWSRKWYWIPFKPKTLIYFITFFFTGLGLLHEILKQKGIEKIKELYMKKLSLSLHKIGVIEENKPEGYVVVGGFVHINQVKL